MDNRFCLRNQSAARLAIPLLAVGVLHRQSRSITFVILLLGSGVCLGSFLRSITLVIMLLAVVFASAPLAVNHFLPFRSWQWKCVDSALFCGQSLLPFCSLLAVEG
ncbi:hypothetical protein AMTR_s00016p00258160 [Amborella trichopoda]|uniref:Uncharacterized protein n=1 Tax=Amborella trichopoda TaxID=13333 RepID=W1PH56_AMBTC|nr:hypothetical protein AMTR_s00016p00258160 [Amborella trichopoda]